MDAHTHITMYTLKKYILELYSQSGGSLTARSREDSKLWDSGLNVSNLSRLRDFTKFGGTLTIK